MIGIIIKRSQLYHQHLHVLQEGLRGEDKPILVSVIEHKPTPEAVRVDEYGFCVVVFWYVFLVSVCQIELPGSTHLDRLMVWRDQDPPATDLLLDFTVPFSGGGSPAYLELDKLPDGRYRATVGTLFEFQELCRTGDLEGLLRHARTVQSSGSFDEMVSAIRAMRALDE